MEPGRAVLEMVAELVNSQGRLWEEPGGQRRVREEPGGQGWLLEASETWNRRDLPAGPQQIWGLRQTESRGVPDLARSPFPGSRAKLGEPWRERQGTEAIQERL